jgi:hypothetical protein
VFLQEKGDFLYGMKAQLEKTGFIPESYLFLVHTTKTKLRLSIIQI